MRAVPPGSLLIVLLQVACGGGGSGGAPVDPPDAGNDATQAESGAGDDDGGDDADPSPDAGPPVLEGTCNNLQAGDAFVDLVDSGTTTSPPAQGGILVSGVYHLASTTYYPARNCVRSPVATTLLVDAASGTSGRLQLATALASGTTFTESIRYVSAGPLLTTRIDCFEVDPGGIQGGAAVLSYTATATELQLLSNSPGCGFSVDSYRM